VAGLNLDLPLILAILVFASGLIWLLDAIFLAPGRRKVIQSLQEKYPGWQKEDSPEAQTFSNEVATKAREPLATEYARSFFPVLLIVFVLRSFIVEPFQIPSGSMIPTLEVGDYILVNKYTYGLRLPVLRDKILAINEPARGDVMVFFPPHKNDTYFIKRVIGLPGDRVEYRNKVLYINGEKIALSDEMRPPQGASRYRDATEALGEVSHLRRVDVLDAPDDFSVNVKPAHYFMMGDNRDDSFDSRGWGQVPERDIVGKAFAVWMHWESIGSVPSFKRVGLIQ
jgi:signal peptidase I